MRFDITGWLKRKTRWEDQSALAAKACLPIGNWEGSGHLMMMMPTMMVTVVMMVMPVVVTMMLFHRSRISAGGAQDRHGERQGQSQPER